MNWKIVECYLAIIIGIVVLACIDYDTWETFVMRCAVIAVLSLLLVCMPYINHRYMCFRRKVEILAERAEIQHKNVQRDLRSMQKTISELQAQIAVIEGEKQAIRSSENTSCTDDELQLFHDSMLVQWAKSNKMPLRDFDKVKSEYDRLRKLNISVNRKE